MITPHIGESFLILRYLGVSIGCRAWRFAFGAGAGCRDSDDILGDDNQEKVKEGV